MRNVYVPKKTDYRRDWNIGTQVLIFVLGNLNGVLNQQLDGVLDRSDLARLISHIKDQDRR